MEAIRINNGIIHLSESKAICPHCERKIPFDEIEDKYMKQNDHTIELKCKCKKRIGIAVNIIGDYVAFELLKKPINELYN